MYRFAKLMDTQQLESTSLYRRGSMRMAARAIFAEKESKHFNEFVSLEATGCAYEQQWEKRVSYSERVDGLKQVLTHCIVSRQAMQGTRLSLSSRW